MAATANSEIANPTVPPQGDRAINAQSAATDASNKMAQEAYGAPFASPADFLKELNKDYALLPKNTPKYLTKWDLEQIAEHNSDAKLRAVALTAGMHFDDLHNMVTSEKPGQHPFLYPSDIAMDLDLETGDLKAYDKAVTDSNSAGRSAELAASIAAGAATIATSEVTPVAVGFATIALTLNAMRLDDQDAVAKRVADAPDAAKHLQSMMAGWSDVNGGK